MGNGQFRQKRTYFAQVSNDALRDNELSLKAKGLYALIQSYLTIENFILYKTTLKKQCSEGEKAFENAWKELKDKGYLVQYRLQGNKGFFYYEYELLDQKSIPSKMGVVDNRPCGEGGQYNNTDLSNTDLNNKDNISPSVNRDIYKSIDTVENKGSKEQKASQSKDSIEQSKIEIQTIVSNAQVELYESEELQSNIIECIEIAYKDSATKETIKKLKLHHIDLAISKFKAMSESKNISNPRIYFLKCLISAIEEFGIKSLF